MFQTIHGGSSSVFRFTKWLLVWNCVVLTVSAQITATIDSFPSAPSGSSSAPHYLIDSDANSLAHGTTRDTMRVTASVRFTRPSPGPAETATYRLSALVLNSLGNPVPITAAVTNNTTATGSDTTVTFPLNQTTVTQNLLISIPSARDLGAGNTYTINCRLQQRTVGAFGQVFYSLPFAARQTPSFTLIHFQDAVEDATKFRARGYVRDSIVWTKIHAHNSATNLTERNFTLLIPYTLARYDIGGNSANVGIRFTVRVRDDLGNEIPLLNDGLVDSTVFSFSPLNVNFPSFPRLQNANFSASIRPTVQLNPAARTYTASVVFSHIETAPSTYQNSSIELASAAQRLLHFNGTLRFGNITSAFTSISNNPAVGSLGAGFVNTTLNAPGGSIPGFPNYSFGAGAVMNVQLSSNGTATLSGGSRTMLVVGGDPAFSDYGKIKVSYPSVTLGTTGAIASSSIIQLPQGLGFTTARGASAGRFLSTIAIPGALTLNSSFRHTTLLSAGGFGNDAWAFDESRPLLFKISACTFTTAGEIEFTSSESEWAHKAAYDQLDSDEAAGLFQTSSMRFRMSNDGHLRFTQLADTSVSFNADPDGTARTKHAELATTKGSFISHFPSGVSCNWTGNGALSIAEGKISDGSSLRNVSLINVFYDGSCPGDACGPAPGSATQRLRLAPQNSNLHFTSDGGLYARSTLTESPRLSWGLRGNGQATHRTAPFTAAEFLIPGTQLYNSENPAAQLSTTAQTAPAVMPSSLLLAGYDSKNHNTPVLYGSKDYTSGLGAYAGVTTDVGSGGAPATSLIGDMETGYDYVLQENVSKYYARSSGISGRHVAAAGSFPPGAMIYGYGFEFTRFQLTYLSNENESSWTNGEIKVPMPSKFDQRFEELKLTCTGSLDQALIDPTDAGSKPLTYWNGSFTPHAISFAPRTGEGCYASRHLIIGLTSGAANIPTQLSGSLAFLKDGNIASLAEGIQGCDGRLGLPAQLKLKGPGNENYTLSPVSKLYFNNFYAANRPESGFVGFATRINVPFFEDIKAHLMTSAQAGIPAAIHLTNGWTENGKTFFSDTGFDSTHRSFPPPAVLGSITVPQYRSPTVVNAFVPRAKQSIFGLVSLDYPLKWSSSGRYFESWDAITNDLFVLKTEHQVDYLSAENAEISFGAQYDGLPEINLVSAAVEVADEQIGAARALTDAASSFITDTLNSGVDDIGNLVNDNLEAILDKAIESAEEQVINPLYVAVVSSYGQAVLANQTYGEWVADGSDGLKANFDRYLLGTTVAPAENLKGRLNQLHDSTAEAANLLARVEDALDRGILAIDSVTGKIEIINNKAKFNLVPPTVAGPNVINGILAKVNGSGGTPERQVVQALVGHLISDLAPPNIAGPLTQASGLLTADINNELNTILAEFDPTLDRITEVLLEARRYLVSVRAKLAAGQDIFTSFQQIITTSSSEITEIVEAIRDSGNQFIDRIARSATYLPNRVLGTAGNLMGEFSKEEFVAFIRAELRDRLLAAAFVQQIQYVLRQQISELDMAMNSAIDSVFSEVSRMCKALVIEALGPIDDTINGLLGDINSVVGAGSLDGYAHIQGDTLRRLRIDAMVQMKVPEDLQLRAYFEMNCYDSDTDTGTSACLENGTQVVEVKIGALDVPLDWISPDMRANLEVRFSMQTQPTVRPSGIGGAFELTGGELDFQSFKITAFAAGIAIGEHENYLAATARVVVSSYEAAGGIFFGKTCSIEPLMLVDPDVGELLGTPPFTGAYVYGEVWIPLSEVVLGIPASCLFRISAGLGAGAFYFVEGPTYGGRMLMGVSGEALCIVSIRGEVSMTGVMNAGSLRFRGRGTLTGKAGACPFCLKFRESANVTYQDGSWSMDY